MKVAKLRDWRHARGLTQAELAHRAGIAQGTISLVERGYGTTPQNAGNLARALGVEIADLMEDPPQRAAAVRLREKTRQSYDQMCRY